MQHSRDIGWISSAPRLMVFNIYRFIAYLVLSSTLSSCSTTPTPSQRLFNAQESASPHNWKPTTLKSEPFNLIAFVPKTIVKNSVLTVYIEGDGLAWISSHKPSIDPTPINPVGLKLALSHHNGNAAYLARPCQYISDTQCETKYWTSHRFSSEVLDASNEAVDKLKHLYSAQQLVLVGYSGGGAVATILTTQRDDVVKLITVAGNLDHKAWTDLHHISPLTGSLNPADYREQLAQVEQVHFVGEDDTVIPPFLANDFVANLPISSHAKVIVVRGQSHGCCWARTWVSLLENIDTLINIKLYPVSPKWKGREGAVLE